MMNRTWLIAGIATALLATAACNPYTTNNGPPAVVSVQATSGSTNLTATVGEASGSAWTVTDSPAVCTPESVDGAATSTATEPLFFITFNKSMNPLSIQTALDDCTPANGWLTVTPVAPTGKRWYSCYTPNASVVGEGASAVIFLGDAPVAADPLACPAVVAVPPPDGFTTPVAPDVSPGAVSTFHLTGTVFDRESAALPIDVTIHTAPDTGPIANFLVTGTTASSIDFAWDPAGCESATTRYQILVGKTVVKTVAPGTPSYTVAINTTDYPALTTTKAESWSVHAVSVTGGTTYDVNSKGVTLLVPGFPSPTGLAAAPGTSVTATGAQSDEVDLQWNAVAIPGVTVKYDVYRAAASDVPGHTTEPGTWARIATNTAETTGTTPFKDKAAAGGTTYFYAVVSKKETTTPGTLDGRSAQTARVTVLTRPARVGAPAFAKVADTTLDVTFAKKAGAVSYQVFRAPNAPTSDTPPVDAPGAYAAVGAPIDDAASDDPVVFSDTGLTANTKYWYQVTATNAAGTTAPGVGAKATTKLLPTPAAPTFGTGSATSAVVNWTAVAGAATYKLERSTADCKLKATTYSVVNTGAALTYTDTGLTSGKRYFYRVTAQAAGVDSSLAGPAALTP